MHCIILFPDAQGRLPTARELRRCGFIVSSAVEIKPEAPVSMPALAAEPKAAYGQPCGQQDPARAED